MIWPQRFLDKIEKVDTGYRTKCWIWTAGCDREGTRPVFQDGGKRYYAHRWAFLQIRGFVPDGYREHLHHRCHQTLCVNPYHLEVLTSAKHRQAHGLIGMAKIHADKKICARGHRFDAINTYVKPNGSRGCRPCRAEDQRAFRARNPGYADQYR